MRSQKQFVSRLVFAAVLCLLSFPMGVNADAWAAPATAAQPSGGVLPGLFTGAKQDAVSPMSIKAQGIRVEIEEKGFATVYIQFAFNSATILPESREEIKNIYALLQAEPAWCLHIAGHTDATGDPAYNLDLSQKRAVSVEMALKDLGVAEGRLTTEGLGGTKPVAENKTAEGRTRNRRVELVRADCPRPAAQ
ncbi:MAG: OmpA family protein [Desulfovibrio sp.]|jgi:outer membrane protein OmpA-like peptidoglycan-associated protein|nr:OmpA family protein [Desulfovibrio sp.]